MDYVADRDNNRIQIFKHNGEFVKVIQRGVNPIMSPRDVKIDTIRRRILIVDSGNNNVELLHLDTLERIFCLPVSNCYGACFDIVGNILIADYNNKKILILSSTTFRAIAIIDTIGSPIGVTTDTDQRIIVTDNANKLFVY